MRESKPNGTHKHTGAGKKSAIGGGNGLEKPPHAIM
jgi:hypothetical protein